MKDNCRFFIDMDGVLSGFSEQFEKHIGLSPDIFKFAYYQKNPDGDYNESFWNAISMVENFWTNMPFLRSGRLLWEYLKGQDYKLKILTAVPEGIETERAKIGKREWVNKNLGSDTSILFTTIQRNNYKNTGKEKYCQNKTDILIDDSIDNIIYWERKGGIGILYDCLENVFEKLESLGL